jgi:hypothetical protein
VNKPAEECGLWLANLKIAEDRIPSLFAVFFPGEDAPVAASSAATLIHTQLELVGRPGPKTDFKTHWVRQSPYMCRACAVCCAVCRAALRAALPAWCLCVCAPSHLKPPAISLSRIKKLPNWSKLRAQLPTR